MIRYLAIVFLLFPCLVYAGKEKERVYSTPDKIEPYTWKFDGKQGFKAYFTVRAKDFKGKEFHSLMVATPRCSIVGYEVMRLEVEQDGDEFNGVYAWKQIRRYTITNRNGEKSFVVSVWMHPTSANSTPSVEDVNNIYDKTHKEYAHWVAKNAIVLRVLNWVVDR